MFFPIRPKAKIKFAQLDGHYPTYRYQGRDFRLTDVHGYVVDDLIE